MAGVRIIVEANGLDRALARIARLGGLQQMQMLDAIGQIVEMQTKRRIASEKTSPAGAPWKPNIEGTSILFRRGYLQGSIHHVAAGVSVRVGSGLVYAAIHQFGGTILPKSAPRLAFTLNGGRVFASKSVIPARPYLGVSAQNAAEIERAIVTAIGAALS